MRVLMVYPNFFDIAQPSLSITILTSYVHSRSNHKIKIFDLTFLRRNWQHHLRKILKLFDSIAISVTQLEYSGALTISKYVKKINPKKPIIWGGICPSLTPEKVIKNKEIDAICIGDGEITFIEYLDHVEHRISLKGVEGLWFKEGTEIIKNEYRPPIQNIDSMPFLDFDIWDLKKYRPYLHSLPFNASRNCPYNCKYCTQNGLRNALGPGYLYRRFSPKRIADELEYQINKYKSTLNFRSVILYDDTLTFDQKFLSEMCDTFVTRKLNHLFRWACNARIENLNESVLLKMKRAGCFYIFFGIESYSNKVRKQYGKNFSNEDVERIIELCRKYRIMIRLYFIINDGLYQTYTEIINTIMWAKKLKPETFHLIPYLPIPFSNMARIFQEKYPQKFQILSSIFDYCEDSKNSNLELAETRAKYSVGIGFGKSMKSRSTINSFSRFLSDSPDAKIFRMSILYSLHNYTRSLVKYGGFRSIIDGFLFLKDVILNDYKIVDFFNAALFKYMLVYSFRRI